MDAGPVTASEPSGHAVSPGLAQWLLLRLCSLCTVTGDTLRTFAMSTRNLSIPHACMSLFVQLACQASADTTIILSKELGLRLWRCSATDTVVFTLKTKQQPLSLLLSIQQKSQTSTLTLSLHRSRPCSQSCPTLLAKTLPNIRSSTDVQGRERAIKAEKNSLARSCPSIVRLQWFEDMLNSLVG